MEIGNASPVSEKIAVTGIRTVADITGNGDPVLFFIWKATWRDTWQVALPHAIPMAYAFGMVRRQ